MGPQGDAGLTGRKIIIDTYGGWGAHGGGAFSGKDPTKVDRSAAYICRQMAKSIVSSGLSKRALVQLSYAIGVSKPLSVFVETYGTEQGNLTADDITNIINKQSPDIAGGVHVGKDDMDLGAGDQGIMFGYASDETEDCMPLTHSMATTLGYTLTEVRKSGKLWWLRPDGKTQVTTEYLQKEDGSVEPQKIHTVLISTQHAEPSKALRTKECAGYTGPEMTAPSMEDMNKAIVEDVVKATLKEIILKNGQPALTLFGDHTHLHINPSGKFIIGGPQGDAGLTGRKIIIDTYGGWGAHGGGAFSGKDPTKVDRSAAYICRQMAKSV